MSSIHWGRPFWVFFHALGATITEEKYNSIKGPLFFHFKQLCSTLPCPDCAQHAMVYLAKVPLPQTLQDFNLFLWAFHNTVNARTHKPLLPVEQLQMYKHAPLYHLFVCMKIAYTARAYNPNLITHNMNKMRNINAFSKWSLEQKLYHKS